MDKSTQLEEIDSLKSIYYEEEFQVTENDDIIKAVFWTYYTLPEDYIVKYVENLDSPEPSCIKLKHLPPVELQLTLPNDYPSKNPPKFVISCQWLNRKDISHLCKKLDEIWSEYENNEIIYSWCDFLKNDSLSYLGYDKELDIIYLCSRHLTHVKKVQKGHSEISFDQNTDGKNISEQEEENSNECLFNEKIKKNTFSEAPVFETTSSLKIIDSDTVKESHNIYHLEIYPYVRKSFKDRNQSSKRNEYKEKSDKRAVLNLNIQLSPIKVLENYSKEREKIEFLRNCYTCNICFCDKLGRDCTQFKDCNHVFCINCIRSYFTVKIKDGNVLSIKCPEAKCSTEALPSQVKEVVSEELFAKYDSVLLTTALDTFGDIIYCPRRFCQYPVSWEQDEKMASCPNCQYVFCVSCKMVYHGVEPCQFKSVEVEKLIEDYETGSAEVKSQLETKYGKKRLENLINNSRAEAWIRDNSKACPKCEVAIEKNQGCNKMVCWKCNAYFCWLCSAILDEKNPYLHYNDPRSHCADKLFYFVPNLEDDEDDWDLIDNNEDEFSDVELYTVDEDYYPLDDEEGGNYLVL